MKKKSKSKTTYLELRDTSLVFHDAMQQRGALTLQILIFGSVAVILLTGFLLWMDVNLKTALRNYDESRAFAITEAGIEYYRWHLAHAPADYQDGTTSTGPYVHNYYDRNNNLIGTFSLDITPPLTGSTIVTVRSTGTLVYNSTIKKIIEVRLGVPSFAKYAAVLNAAVRFGAGTEVFGEIHSNNGVRFDGLAHNLVKSSVASYDDPDHSGANEFGVHTHVVPVDPFPPAAVPSRPDVFQIGRQFPVPAVDFAGLTSDLADIKANASSSGFYRASSTALGYHVVLKTDDTFDLYRVTTLVAAPGGCTNSLGQSGWGTWSIQNQVLLGNYAFPGNSLIFLEDNVWLDGQINGARLTIASARFPDNAATRSSITVNNNLLYTNYDGTDVIGLIAQNNLNIGMVSADTLRVDAALIAQNGRVGRYYYQAPGGGSNRCQPYHVRTLITAYGMLGSSLRYGFAYTDGTGYITRSLSYDGNLLYGPPPSFPLTNDPYAIISWDEVK